MDADAALWRRQSSTVRGLLAVAPFIVLLIQNYLLWQLSGPKLKSNQPIREPEWPYSSLTGISMDGHPQPERAEAVKSAMKHAWKGYCDYAWGADELRPVSKKPKHGLTARAGHGFAGMGASIIDSMSTLHVMGLNDEFARGRDWVAANISFSELYPDEQPTPVSFFEVTIRVLGGLLSAYDLSGDKIFLEKAEDLGRRLLPAFAGSPTGIVTNKAELPWTLVKTADSMECLAEIGTNILEWGILSLRTRNNTYKFTSENGLRFLHWKNPDEALMGSWIDRHSGRIVRGNNVALTIGSPSDSYYEYLLKHWIGMGDTRDDHWRERWVAAVDSSFEVLRIRPMSSPLGMHYSFVGERQGRFIEPYLSHMVCFWPGNIALGVLHGAVNGTKAQMYLDFAREMALACYQLYNSTATGLGVEGAYVDVQTGTFYPTGTPYLLRPEVIESLFILYRVTHDEMYREWAWEIFQRIEYYCKQEAGYTGLRNPYQLPAQPNDQQETWLLAETFKYLYLMFSDDSLLDLHEWVFNTEAHPLRIGTTSSIT